MAVKDLKKSHIKRRNFHRNVVIYDCMNFLKLSFVRAKAKYTSTYECIHIWRDIRIST